MMPASRSSSTSDYPLTTLSHRSSLNLGSGSTGTMPRLDVDAGPSTPTMSRSNSRSGRKGKKRLSDGGGDEEESAALLGRGDMYDIDPVGRHGDRSY